MSIEQVRPGHIRYEIQFPTRGSLPYTSKDQQTASRALLTIGHAIFEFERLLKNESLSHLDIVVEKVWADQKSKKKIEACIERFISYVFLSETKVRLKSIASTIDMGFGGEESSGVDTICLFSGGVDSLSGILSKSIRPSKTAAVFCSHIYQARVVHLVREFQDTLLSEIGIPLYEVPVPAIDAAGYAQSRGLLYVLAAASVAAALSAKRIVVSECGPTMYQPRFGPADQVTMTTHPFVMNRAMELINEISPELTLEVPFEDNTKAEVMALCSKPAWIQRSHSCISQRLTVHDGTCYGCVIRRLASIATSIPDTNYQNNPLIDENAHCGNLLAVLDFCGDFLIDPDGIPSYQRQLVDQYGKFDLYKRFSLDNYAALHRLRRKQKLSPPVERAYKRVVRHLSGAGELQRRLDTLRKILSESKS